MNLRMPDTFLGRSLFGNALFSTLSGLILLLAAGPLSAWMGVVDTLTLRVIGGVLLFFALDLFQQSSKAAVPRWKAFYFVVMDVAWVLGSAVLIWGLALPFTTAGQWTILLVADVVGLFAVLQWIGLRRLP